MHWERLVPNMELKTVFSKTDKGQDEIATRQNRLPARVRAMLITVDGQRSVQALVSGNLFGEAGAHEYLSALLENGYIVEKNESSVPAKPILSAPAEPVSEVKDAGQVRQTVVNATPYAQQVTGDIALARRFVAQSIYEIFGPDVDMFALSIEGVKTAHELLHQMEKMRDALVASVGKKRVEELWAKTFLLLA
jgi:hypothetical protein